MNDITGGIGQLFIVGFPDERPSREWFKFLAEERIGGVILFGDNCPSHPVIRENIAEIQVCLDGTRPFIAIDQEGGRVSRIKGKPAEIDSAASYAASNNLERFREHYSRSAVYMESVGINLNLAPVADIFLNEANDCLADRCYGTTSEQVSEFVKASVEVSTASGLLSCLKHFPGLGVSTVDPHQSTAIVACDPIVWEQREKIPFAAGIEAGADMVMTTHARFPTAKSEIVTGSERVLKNVLRQRLGFDGPIITDDLCMSGADSLGSYGERAVAAFSAGHDILLFGQNMAATVEAYDYFRDAVERGEITEERLRASLSRVSGIKFKLRNSLAPRSFG